MGDAKKRAECGEIPAEYEEKAKRLWTSLEHVLMPRNQEDTEAIISMIALLLWNEDRRAIQPSR